MRLPSRLKTTLLTASVWPWRSRTCSPVCASQTFTVWSSEALARRVPIARGFSPPGLKATLFTPPVWPLSSRSCRPPACRPPVLIDYQRGGFPGLQGIVPQLLLQAAAGAELQREEGQAVVLADLVDLHGVGVRQPGDGLGLGLEALPRLRRGVGAVQDHLQRHDAVELYLPGPVDDAHAAAAQFAQDLVTGKVHGGLAVLVPRCPAAGRGAPTASSGGAVGKVLTPESGSAADGGSGADDMTCSSEVRRRGRARRPRKDNQNPFAGNDCTSVLAGREKQKGHGQDEFPGRPGSVPAVAGSPRLGRPYRQGPGLGYNEPSNRLPLGTPCQSARHRESFPATWV
jgi:hypothetical protein